MIIKNEELRRLLKLAAKALGAELKFSDGWFYKKGTPLLNDQVWWPSEDDGDSRRLEVDLNIEVRWHLACGANTKPGVTATAASNSGIPVMREAWGHEPCKDAKRKAARMAVLRVAAAIGEAMP